MASNLSRNSDSSALLALVLAPLLVLVGCAGEPPTIQTGDDAESIMGTLNKVDNARTDLAYVDPTVDYSRYSKVLVKPLDVDNVEIIQPGRNTSEVNRYNTEWALSDANKQKLQDAFMESMHTELTQGGAFSIVDTGGDDVIVLEAMLTSIAPSAPMDSTDSRGVGRSRIYTEGAGGMSIAIMFADGDSGEVIALVKDTRNSSNSNWGVNNSVTNMAEVRRNFNAWAKRMHDGLLGLRALTEAPGN